MVAPCARLRVPKFVLGIVDFHGQLIAGARPAGAAGFVSGAERAGWRLGTLFYRAARRNLGVWPSTMFGSDRAADRATAFEPRHLAGLCSVRSNCRATSGAGAKSSETAVGGDAGPRWQASCASCWGRA